LRPSTISIIGLGVIGGSLGLAIKKSNPLHTVIGFDTRAVLAAAGKRKAIDVAARSLDEAVARAEIIFLCAPVSAMLALIPLVAKTARPNAIVTDVGSVKGIVQSVAGTHFRRESIFVGGHPMAGSERSGVKYADPLLFQNAAYVLCPLDKQRKRIGPLIELLRSIGAHVVIMDAMEHDRVTAAVSHLPQLVAVEMMNYVAKKNKGDPAYLHLAAGGFRDMTRIASSPFPMWNDIILQNKKEIRTAVKEFEGELHRLQSELSKKSLSEIRQEFHRARKFRDSIPQNSKGFFHSLHDIFVWVDDRPGALAKITGALFKSGINIRDIELLKVREGEGGTFRLWFESAEAASKAFTTLRRRGFQTAK
jgi:prephenate dehydrogenase